MLLEEHFRVLFCWAIKQHFRLTLEVFVEEGERVPIDNRMCPLAPNRPAEANEWEHR